MLTEAYHLKILNSTNSQVPHIYLFILHVRVGINIVRFPKSFHYYYMMGSIIFLLHAMYFNDPSFFWWDLFLCLFKFNKDGPYLMAMKWFFYFPLKCKSRPTHTTIFFNSDEVVKASTNKYFPQLRILSIHTWRICSKFHM